MDVVENNCTIPAPTSDLRISAIIPLGSQNQTTQCKNLPQRTSLPHKDTDIDHHPIFRNHKNESILS
jgi:hypothetical protein